MSNTYTVIIQSIMCLPTYQDQTEVVYNLNWILSGTDGVNTHSTQGAQRIEFGPTSQFTPFNSLTSEQVLSWLNNSEPFASQVSIFKSDIDNHLRGMGAVSMTPPWNT